MTESRLILYARRAACATAILIAGQVVALADADDGRNARPGNSLVAQAVASDPPPSTPGASIPLHAWRVVAVEGEAHVLADTGQSIDWTALRAGQELPPNVQIETGSESQVLLFNGSDAITVYSDTRLGLPEIEAGSTAVDVYQNRGSADYHVRDRESGFSLQDLFIGVGRLLGADEEELERFRVFAPRLTTVVKGTVFTVTVLRDQTNVMVSDGVVEVIDPRSGADADVLAGQLATARPDVAAGIHLRSGVDTLFDPSTKVPSINQSSRVFGLQNDRDDGDEAAMQSDGGSIGAAGTQSGSGSETAASTSGGAAGGGSGGDTYSIADGPDEGGAAGGAGGSASASASGGGAGGSVESASSGGGGAAGSGGGAGAASSESGGSSDSAGGEVAAGDSGSDTESAASSASASSDGDRWGGGGSITISGTGDRGTSSVTISRDGITTTRDESATGDRSVTISGSGESGSFSTTISDEGVESTVSGPDGATGDAGSGTP